MVRRPEQGPPSRGGRILRLGRQAGRLDVGILHRSVFVNIAIIHVYQNAFSGFDKRIADVV